MDRQKRRAVAYISLLVTVVVGYTLAYQMGMARFEGETVSILHAFHIVVETFTTTGFGEDAPWTSPAMLGLVVSMQLTGVFLIFLTLPLFVVPWVERRLEVEPPTEVEMADHVVICGFSDRGEALVDELEGQEVPYIIVESDRDRAQDRYEDGEPVIFGNPESTEVLKNACVADARAVVIDESDEHNATIALSVREIDDEVQTLCFAEDPEIAVYLQYAGADQVLSPHDILGRSLADKVTSAVTTSLGETVEIGDDFEIVEMPIQGQSALDGVRLSESGIRERTGANVIGAWFSGEFVGAPDPDRTIDRHCILLVAGRADQLETLKDLTQSTERRRRTEGVILAGYGEVGSTVKDALAAKDIKTTIVDREEKPGVDVVGDITNEDTLLEAGLGDVGAVILALGEDTATVFATLVIREARNDVDVICRVDERESASKLYAAGADYVLALAAVSGRMLAQDLLGEDVMALDKQIDIVRTTARHVSGKTLAEANIRARTGCTVIAVERDDTVISDLGPEFRLQRDDALIVAGTDEHIARFNEVFSDGRDPAP
jgi:Trk K+ transport system NAD-binding subunit